MNYKLPLRLANKIITSGPVINTIPSDNNWKIISTFILYSLISTFQTRSHFFDSHTLTKTH